MNIKEINERFEFFMLVKADQHFVLPEKNSFHFPIEYREVTKIHGNCLAFIKDKRTNLQYSVEVGNKTDEMIRNKIIDTINKILESEQES